MPFYEKSAWTMGLALLAASLVYLGTVMELSEAMGGLAPPSLPLIIGFTICLTLVVVAGHLVIVYLAPQDAHAAPNERERKLLAVASGRAGYVLSTGVACSLCNYLFSTDGNLLFYTVLASLVLAQLTEYAWQIILCRKTIPIWRSNAHLSRGTRAARGPLG